MSRIVLVAVCLAVLVVPVHPIEPPKFKTLAECQAKVDGLYSWYNESIDKHNRLIHDYDALERQNLALISEVTKAKENPPINGFGVIGAIAGGIGAGFAMGYFARTKPPSVPATTPQANKPSQLAGWWRRKIARNDQKQLLVLLVGAAWVSVAALIGVNDSALSHHPVNMVFTIFAYSIPALALGGVGFWWFAKAKQKEPMQ